jgi:hypothetical protein
MAREPSQKLVDYGIIAGILFGAYVLWNFAFKTEKKECPVGQHAVNPCEGQIGWVGFLCTLGRNVTGALLDCKPDEIVCPEGYTLQNGQCTAVFPGGCTITDAQCKAADPRTYLNLTDCQCHSSAYTDECTLGATKCENVPGGVGRLQHECIFVPVFGNRWQIAQPERTCSPSMPGSCSGYDLIEGGRYLAARLDAGDCFTPEQIEWARNCDPVMYNWVRDLGCPETPVVPNIVDCGDGCGLVDLNNPPGTTCEEVCKPLWTPGCVQDVAECRRLNENTPGGLFSGFMSRSQCEGAGYIFVDNPPGYCANQARLDYDKLRGAACCW